LPLEEYLSSRLGCALYSFTLYLFSSASGHSAMKWPRLPHLPHCYVTLTSNGIGSPGNSLWVNSVCWSSRYSFSYHTIFYSLCLRNTIHMYGQIYKDSSLFFILARIEANFSLDLFIYVGLLFMPFYLFIQLSLTCTYRYVSSSLF
jgi:hypothetical protein